MGAISIPGQGLTAVLGDNGVPTADDLAQRRVPRRRHKMTGALGTDATQRGEHALRRMHALSIAVHLTAEKAPCERVFWIAYSAHHLPRLYRHQYATGIRAVVRTHRAHCLTRSRSLHCFSLLYTIVLRASISSLSLSRSPAPRSSRPWHVWYPEIAIRVQQVRFT